MSTMHFGHIDSQLQQSIKLTVRFLINTYISHNNCNAEQQYTQLDSQIQCSLKEKPSLKHIKYVYIKIFATSLLALFFY